MVIFNLSDFQDFSRSLLSPQQGDGTEAGGGSRRAAGGHPDRDTDRAAGLTVPHHRGAGQV